MVAASLFAACNLSSSLGSSKKVRLVIRSDVDHIATSIGQLSVSRGKLTSPEYLYYVRGSRIGVKDVESVGLGLGYG